MDELWDNEEWLLASVPDYGVDEPWALQPAEFVANSAHQVLSFDDIAPGEDGDDLWLTHTNTTMTFASVHQVPCAFPAGPREPPSTGSAAANQAPQSVMMGEPVHYYTSAGNTVCGRVPCGGQESRQTKRSIVTRCKYLFQVQRSSSLCYVQNLNSLPRRVQARWSLSFIFPEKRLRTRSG